MVVSTLKNHSQLYHGYIALNAIKYYNMLGRLQKGLAFLAPITCSMIKNVNKCSLEA